MRPCFKRFLILSVLSLLLFFTVPAGAYNVTVSPASSEGGSFVGAVWTPFEDSNLSFDDLNTRLASGNVEISTNGVGNVIVVASFPYTQAVPRLLTLSAQGTVMIQGIQASSAALSVAANASGTVTVNAAGTILNGGAFSSYGTDFLCQHSGLNTGGGAVALTHTGTVTITDGGLRTGGGGFTSSGTDFSCTVTGLNTGGGDVVLNHPTGNITITGNGLSTESGNFTSSGTDFYSADLSTGGGAVILNHTGAVTFSASGLNTGTDPPASWGPLTSYGTDFTVESAGAQTGEVILHHTGAVALTGGGINTHNSDFTSYGTDFSAAGSGLVPGAGNVTIDHTGAVTFSGVPFIMSGGAFVSSGTDFSSSTGIDTNGGAILLNHPTGTVTFSGMVGTNTGGGYMFAAAENLFIQQAGLHTDNGAVTFNCTGNITISDFGGLTTNGGSILMESDQSILINAGSVFASGGTNDGGDITLRAFMGITADSPIDSSPGSGGTLTLDGNTAAIRLNATPVVGAGNIYLYADPSSVSIPTLSEWGMILMTLVLLGAAARWMRRGSFFTPRA